MPWLLAPLIVGSLQVSPAAGRPPLESEVKSVFLLNFTKFVEWPAESFSDPDSPVVLCVRAGAPIVPVLERVVRGEMVDRRKVVMQTSPPYPAKACHIFFAGKSERGEETIPADIGRNVLTVGEDEGFLAAGGMIEFVIEDRRVRFDINQKAVGNSALKLSSKLYNVARRVAK